VIWLYVYVGISIFFGGCAFALELWWISMSIPLLERADGRGYFKSPAVSALALGLFAAIVWPLLLVGAIL